MFVSFGRNANGAQSQATMTPCNTRIFMVMKTAQIELFSGHCKWKDIDTESISTTADLYESAKMSTNQTRSV